MHCYDFMQAGNFWLVIYTLLGNVWKASHVDGGNKGNVVHCLNQKRGRERVSTLVKAKVPAFACSWTWVLQSVTSSAELTQFLTGLYSENCTALCRYWRRNLVTVRVNVYKHILGGVNSHGYISDLQSVWHVLFWYQVSLTWLTESIDVCKLAEQICMSCKGMCHQMLELY